MQIFPPSQKIIDTKDFGMIQFGKVDTVSYF